MRREARRVVVVEAVIVANRWGGSLRMADRPVPEPGPGELLVRVCAAGVNPADWKMRSGVTGCLLARAIPEIPGTDVAGVVESAGPGGDSPGLPVLGCTGRGGGYAEWALLRQEWTVPKPAALGFAEAAALPVAGLTALQALRDRARLAPGQRLLVNGASGGVGSFAVQLGRILGAKVAAVTSTGNLEFVRSLGAAQVIDYTQGDFTRLPDQYDVIFDVVANHGYLACQRQLTEHGIYITTLPGPASLSWTALTRLGAYRGRRAVIATVRPTAADLAYLADLAVTGQLRAVVERTFPLADAGAAWAASRGGHVRGKLVLSMATAPAAGE